MTVEELLVIAQGENGPKKISAEEELIKRHQKLVRFLARAYFLAGSDTNDLEQIGRIGLLKAIRSYRVNSGAQFITYASRCIKNEILEQFAGAKGQKFICTVDIDEFSDFLTDEFTEQTIVESIFYKNLLEQALKDAKEIEQKVLRLYLKGYSYKDIGKKLSVSHKKVDNIMQKIEKILNQVCKIRENSVK